MAKGEQVRVIGFGDGPKIEPLIKAEVWRLTEDFVCHVYGPRGRLTITVPKGFLTDGASIPRFLWRFCGHPMMTRRIRIAVVHDFIYAERGKVSVRIVLEGRNSLRPSQPQTLTRQEADALYRDGLICLGFKGWKATLEYWMIRIFGGSHWESCE